MLVFLAFALLVGCTAFSSSAIGKSADSPSNPSQHSQLSLSHPSGQLLGQLLGRSLKLLHWSIGSYADKSKADWILDGLGLITQGIVIPALQVTVIYRLWSWIVPSWENAIHLGWGWQFSLSFVCVDYLYYWNHRGLHHPWLWNAHKVHHSVTQMDVLGTSRNTLWSSFLIVYLWVHALMIMVLAHPGGYVFGVSLTAVLDLWRHSSFSLRPDQFRYPWLYALIAPWLILPHDHAWHHSNSVESKNFGGNFKLWDKIHGTYLQKDTYPSSIGVSLNLTTIQKLFMPIAKPLTQKK
ncbi:MAG: sterol desaturase family protein [Leptolyngbyaceae bacterium]|nr:sterol desaturase family protein [Leptolyngbyaceae bacterium]